MSWSLYVIQTAEGSLYTGISTDPARRFEEHQQGRRGARYLRGRGPLEMVYQVNIGERGMALRAEYAFKQLTRARKLALVSEAPSMPALLTLLSLD